MKSKTLQDEFLEYRLAIEAGTVPKTLTAAFAAGVRAALYLLADPFACCVLGAERIQEIDQQLDQMSKVSNTPKTAGGSDSDGGREKTAKPY